MLDSWTYSFQTSLYWLGLLPHHITAELRPLLHHIFQPHIQEVPFHIFEEGITTTQGVFVLNGALVVTLLLILSSSFCDEMKCSFIYTIMASDCSNADFPWLYLYRARSKITQLLTPTHAQLQHHRLKFIKKPFKNSYMFRSTTIFRELQYPR